MYNLLSFCKDAIVVFLVELTMAQWKKGQISKLTQKKNRLNASPEKN